MPPWIAGAANASWRYTVDKATQSQVKFLGAKSMYDRAGFRGGGPAEAHRPWWQVAGHDALLQVADRRQP